MPLARGISQGLSVGIPLAVKKFALDQEQFRFEQLMQTKQDNLELARNELQEEKRAAKIKVLTESAKEFAEAGDQEGLSSIHEQLVGLGQMGLPEVPGMSPDVLDIAQQLRGEGGVPLEEGIPRKFYTPPSPLDQFKGEKEFEHGLKMELEKLKQGEKTKKGDISKTSEAYLTKQLTDGEIDWETYVKKMQRIKGTKEEKGKLTEGSVLKMISDHALLGGGKEGENPEDTTARLYGEYLEFRGDGLSREKAINKTIQRPGKPSVKDGEKDYSSLWSD